MKDGVVVGNVAGRSTDPNIQSTGRQMVANQQTTSGGDDVGPYGYSTAMAAGILQQVSPVGADPNTGSSNLAYQSQTSGAAFASVGTAGAGRLLSSTLQKNSAAATGMTTNEEGAVNRISTTQQQVNRMDSQAIVSINKHKIDNKNESNHQSAPPNPTLQPNNTKNQLLQDTTPNTNINENSKHQAKLDNNNNNGNNNQLLRQSLMSSPATTLLQGQQQQQQAVNSKTNEEHVLKNHHSSLREAKRLQKENRAPRRVLHLRVLSSAFLQKGDVI